MTWNPSQARTLLDSNPLLNLSDEKKKLSAFKLNSGRELALIEENKSKVSIYLSCAPLHMPDVFLDETYEPSSSKKGRHSNLALITESLGFEHKVYKVHVKSDIALKRLIEWYQYA